MIVSLALLAGLAFADPPAPAAPPAPAKPAAPTACAGGEVWFQCGVKGGKEVVVCGATGELFWLSYVYGKPGAPELVFPAAREGSIHLFTWEAITTLQAQGDLLRFQNNDVTYEIVEMVGAGGPNGAANNFSGIYVKQGEKTLATIGCTQEPTAKWDEIKNVLAAGQAL